MKRLLLLVLLAALTSCSKDFYQIYRTEAVTKNAQTNVFENADCRISYDFWAEGGDAGFTIFNKTSEPLTVHMDKSFYIVNGRAYDYFQARTFSTTSRTTASGFASTYIYGLTLASASSVTSENGTTYEERPQIVIPAKSSKSFREYKINLSYYANCDMKPYPTKSKVKTLTFSAENSPFLFSNSITYSVGSKTSTAVHDFFVSEITNLPKSEEIKKAIITNCDKKIGSFQHVNYAPSNFYLHYVRK